jgi:hypothetical protein
MTWSRTRLAAALIVAMAAFGSATHGTSASETLAYAGFENDIVGAAARPGGPLTVEEQVYDDSDTTGGVSAVEAHGGGRRYRLSDVGTQGGRRGIRAPLSSTASSGTLVASAVVTPGQTGAGGSICLSTPDEVDWTGMVAIGSDGKFSVHGTPTDVSYTSGRSYRVEVTVAFGNQGSVDYSITDLTDSSVVVSSSGHPVPTNASVGSLFFTTDGSTDGTFAVDDLSAVLQ